MMAKLAGPLVVIKDIGEVQNWQVAKVVNGLLLILFNLVNLFVHNNSIIIVDTVLL